MLIQDLPFPIVGAENVDFFLNLHLATILYNLVSMNEVFVVIRFTRLPDNVEDC